MFLSLYFVAFFVGIIVVVYWTRQNDAVPPGEKTKGFLRMTFRANSASNPPGAAGEAGPATQDSAPYTDRLGRRV